MKRLVLFLLTFASLSLIGTSADAGTIQFTDPRTGGLVTLEGSWTIEEERGFIMAMSEEGCFFIVAEVPSAKAEALSDYIDEILTELFPNLVETSSEVKTNENGVILEVAAGTVDGKPVDWIALVEPSNERFTVIIAMMEPDAEYCTSKMMDFLKMQ